MKNILSHKVIMSVLAFVMAAGGYGGYEVVKTHVKYGSNFENRLHLVEEIVDGDTLIIENGIRIRLLGIDAPEIDQCFGDKAKKELAKLVLGQQIVLEKDQTAIDNYGRLLRYVILHQDNPEVSDKLLNNVLVQKGLAKALYIKPNRRYLSLLQSSQIEAEEEKHGMWGSCNYTVNANPEREEDSAPFDKECVIKGSIGKSYEKSYFVPGCPNYKRVKVDPRKGEKWFCTTEEAKKDGWEISQSCNNI